MQNNIYQCPNIYGPNDESVLHLSTILTTCFVWDSLLRWEPTTCSGPLRPTHTHTFTLNNAHEKFHMQPLHICSVQRASPPHTHITQVREKWHEIQKKKKSLQLHMQRCVLKMHVNVVIFCCDCDSDPPCIVKKDN